MELKTDNKFQYQLIHKSAAQINVDCIKVCPFDSNLFAFAYYQQAQNFLGGVSIQYFNQKQQSQSKLVEEFQILQLGPILHICWLNRKIRDNYILIGASRSQKIFIFSVSHQKPQQNPIIKLQKEIFIQLNVFCLYLDAVYKNQSYFDVVVSTNQSEVFQLHIDQNYELLQKKKYNKHQYAVWTCRLNQFSQKRMFACGDEVNSIYIYDQEGNLVQKNSKAHYQGICDIVFVNQFKMYTGGFDGWVNQFDLRNFKVPVKTFKLGGTIWRILPDQQCNNLLICNSSQKKFQIIESFEGKQIWNSGTEHQSLAYSADWNKSLLLTSSFYDKVVCLWKK